MGDLEALYRQHRFAVLRRCKQLLHDPSEAEEVVQDVFLKLLERPHAWQRRCRISTFLYSMATHACLNRLRHGGRRGAAWQDQVRLASNLRAARLDPEGTAAAAELVQLVIAETDPRTQAIVVYHLIDGLPQGEVAGLVGLSRVSVNLHLGRFLARARQQLGVAA